MSNGFRAFFNIGCQLAARKHWRVCASVGNRTAYGTTGSS